ncbi:MAG: pentapeptide repeat-containing protein [Flavobacterium sp.]|nr:pentapeptide repeat-containing protein [Flavobacterium sp.]
MSTIVLNKVFEKEILAGEALTHVEYEECSFVNCDFQSADLRGSVFINCEFTDCNLANVNLRGTGLKSVAFVGCKLLGVLFNECTDFLFEVNFHHSVLDYSSFANKKMQGTTFDDCSLKDVNFSSADLSRSTFSGSNLDRAQFYHTILKEVNFVDAVNYKIDPEDNVLQKARFSLSGIPGLLSKHQIKIE